MGSGFLLRMHLLRLELDGHDDYHVYSMWYPGDIVVSKKINEYPQEERAFNAERT